VHFLVYFCPHYWKCTVQKTKLTDILRRNWLIKHVIEGRIHDRVKVKGTGGRRRKQLLDDLKKATFYWKLKEETLDRTLWEKQFRIGCGTVVTPNMECMNEWINKFENHLIIDYFTSYVQNVGRHST